VVLVRIIASSASSASAAAAEPTVQELKKQIAQLESRLETLEAKQAATNEDVARTVQEIVKDAEKRSVFLATNSEITAGYDKGFFIRSSDGNFELRPGLLMQFRNITNVITGDDDDIQNGFELRRLRPRIDGNAFTKDFIYSIVLDTPRNGGNLALLDAWGQYRVAPTWAVKFGQFRNSWVHEGDTPDANQLTVERSLVDAILAGSQTDRVQGVSLIYGGIDATPMRAEVTFDDGDNSKNTDFQDINSSYGASIRGEYKLAGKWADYRDFSARGTKENLLVVGAGANWNDGSADSPDILRTTVDVQYETASRWNFYAELNGNVIDDAGDSSFDWGGLLQAGYAIDQRWEPFARYDVVVLDDNAGGNDAFNEFTIGVGYYLGPDGSYGTRAKVTVDLLYLPDGAPSNQTGVGVLASDDAEFVFRTQLQLVL
jgi:hypothetical protein